MHEHGKVCPKLSCKMAVQKVESVEDASCKMYSRPPCWQGQEEARKDCVQDASEAVG